MNYKDSAGSVRFLSHFLRRLIYRLETEFGLKWDGVFRCHFPDRSVLATLSTNAAFVGPGVGYGAYRGWT